MNVARWLERAGRRDASLPALGYGHDVVVEYGALARRCAGLGGQLRAKYGLAAGDRVAVVAKNHPSYVEALFAIWWAGLVAVPVNSKLHRSEVAWILDHAGIDVAFASADLEADLGAIDGVELIVFDSAEYARLCRCDAGPVTDRLADDLGWLFYTSGTTGRPKGAMLTHRNLVAMSLAYLAGVDPTQPGDALLHAAPMSHGSGLYAIAHVCQMAMNIVPESGGFDAAEALELIDRRPGTSMFAAPTMIRRLVDCPEEFDPAAIRTLIWGGAPMHVPDVVRAIDRLGPCLAQIYGQGESPMTISVLSKDAVADRAHPRWLERLGSAGAPNPAVDVRVVNSGGAELAVGEAGEIMVRGDTVMRGYWNDEPATAKTLRDGWLHTGDVGCFDDEGYLTLKDRATDMIISGGSNIYPREVEEVLTAHAAVREVSVIGRPDPEWGEVVIAYVVGDAGPTELDRLCLEHIARFKRPKEYVFVASLPKNNNGKIVKDELRSLDRAHAALGDVADS